jgi:hypothetical protein
LAHDWDWFLVRGDNQPTTRKETTMTKKQKRQLYADAWLPQLWAVTQGRTTIKTFCYRETAEAFASELVALGGVGIKVEYTK